jgi:tetratricopeptide (TPR) repeat protein
MQLSEHRSPPPEAFRGFIEGIQNLHDYLRTNAGERLKDAKKQFDESLAADPNFAPAQYYKAIVLTHAREADAAIELLEGLNRESTSFRAEVLYNLAFAYARKYRYDLFRKSLALLDEAQKAVGNYTFWGVTLGPKRLDLVLLIKAMRAFVMAAFAGRQYGHSEDFEQRRVELLPKAEKLAKSVLADRRLTKLTAETRTAVEVEAHNAAGIANMRMGQYSRQFVEDAAFYWNLSKQQYRAALELHSRDVRVLDNLSTLSLMRACHAKRRGQLEDVCAYGAEARDYEDRAISFNPHDRFRWLNLARAYVLLAEWEKASIAATRILEEPGVPMEGEVEVIKDAIRGRDVTLILEKYPTEEKSPA